MKILVFGLTGMLGHKLVQALQEKFEVWATMRGRYTEIERLGIISAEKVIERTDAENYEQTIAAIERVMPDVVINAVGVIKQLPTSKDVIKTLTLNSIFPHQLAELAGRYGFRLITIGTDCVFSGAQGNYTEDDVPDALDLYGKSKNFGELPASANCLTLRTSIIGPEIRTAHSLVEWFLSNRGGRVRGYVNAIYSGFPTVYFAEIIADLIENHPQLEGLYHVSSEPINKYELLRLINESYGAGIEIEPYEDFRIDRSLNSDRFRAATNFRPPDWPALVAQMAEDAAAFEKR